jgi:chromosome partitioning protein
MGAAKTRVIACANQKGGVGKTTTATHLAIGLHRAGRRTRLLDLDPQENAILCLSQDLQESKGAMAIPGWKSYRATEGLEILKPQGAPTSSSLKRACAEDQDLEYVIIDCPPSLERGTGQALEAAHFILIPLQCEFLAMQGLAQILTRVQGLTQDPQIWVLPVMLESEKNIHQEVLEELRAHLPDQICQTWIPRDPYLSEASSFGVSLFTHGPRAVGAQAYAKLVREVCHGWT